MIKETRINLLKNSTGLLGSEFWTHTGKSISTLSGDVDTNVKNGVGTGCVLVLENSSGNAVFANSSSFKVKPNTNYTVSGYYYVGNGCSGIHIHMKGIEDNSSKILCADTIYSAGNYKYFCTSLTTSNTVKKAYIEIANLGGDGKKVYFGQIMVQEGISDTGWVPNPNELADNKVKISGNEVMGPYKSSDNQYQTFIEDGIINITNNGKNGLMMRGDQTSGRVNIYKDGGTVGTISMTTNYGSEAFEVHSEKNYPLALSNNDGAYFLLSGSNIYHSGNLLSSSDLNLKKDIVSIDKEKAVAVVKNLNPVEFKFNTMDNSKHFGLVAQELEKVLNKNDFITEDYSIIHINEKGEYSVNYTEIIPLLIRAIQGLQEKFDNLNN